MHLFFHHVSSYSLIGWEWQLS